MYSEEFQERFWKKVNKTDTCWLWTGKPTSFGYARVKCLGKQIMAHRISLEIHLNRKIQDGYDVAHAPIICHNRLCVNPGHLREATRQENMADRKMDNTNVVFEMGQKNPTTRKLTEEQVRAIRLDTDSINTISEKYNIARKSIYSIKSRQYYAWVTD